MVTIRRMRSAFAPMLVSVLALVAASGCATKGFVRQEVAGVRGYTDTKVGEVQGEVGQVRTLAERLASGNVEIIEISSSQVQFAFDDYRLDSNAQMALDQVGASIASHPRYVIEIRGFADATGSDRYNYKLGRERAEEIVRYLSTRHNVPTTRIAVVSFGEESPVADNESEDGRAQNRRAQVRLLEVKPAGEPTATIP